MLSAWQEFSEAKQQLAEQDSSLNCPRQQAKSLATRHLPHPTQNSSLQSIDAKMLENLPCYYNISRNIGKSNVLRLYLA